MPDSSFVADRSHAKTIAACVEIVTGHAVTVIVRARIGTGRASVGRVVSIRIVIVQWAAKNVAGYHARTEWSDNRAFPDGTCWVINAPPNPILDLGPIGISRGAGREDIVVVVEIHRHAEP